MSENSITGSTPRLVVETAGSFNYAAWQNAVPLLNRLAIDNSGGEELSQFSVEFSSSPRFTRNKRWNVDRVAAGETLVLKDLDLDVDRDFLAGLDEAERGVLTFRLFHQENLLQEVRHDVRVLARDEWGGMESMAELLPAFVTPNDPALAALLKSAATLLAESGHSSTLEGYQSNDANRVYLLAAALWSAVAGRSITYANPPGSFERVGQKTRRVGTVLNDGLATCLDSTLLFASGLEAIGLHPVVIMLAGHCFVGVWLVKKSFKQLVEPECSELRKAIAARELVVFETTLATRRPPASFAEAIAAATDAVSESQEEAFVAVIDVSRARMAQILPLASHIAREEGIPEEAETGPMPLPAAPGFTELPTVETEERPQTPDGRIERWQRKLLDLSLRNRLLNFRPSRQSVPVFCPDVSRLEDRLADGARLRLISLDQANPVAQRNSTLHQQRTGKQLDPEFAGQALDRDEIACPVESRELEARLTALYRKVRNDLAEGGSNTLYLAVGFLRWKKKAGDDRTFRAPLLLVPVQLVRRSTSSPFYLVNHEDEVRFNATLLQMLKKDFDCDLTAFESNLPMDDSGVNVPQVLERMRRAVHDIPGFEVVEEATIAPFSFAKYLMWKDLVDRVDRLTHNRVVRHLIQDPDKPFESAGDRAMPRPQEIDVRYAPQDIVHPLPADSSQLAAVMAASEGHDLVIVGPPGTGKSQTIANIIAQCLAMKKTVLFVAEKTAALDVVYRRLREHGLDDCCIELHSNKAERRRFLGQLEASWKNRRKKSNSDWLTVNEKLRVRRDQLNAYAAAVHSADANGWTPYRAMGECVRGLKTDAPRLTWPATVRHDRVQYQQLEATVAELSSAFASIPPDGALPRVQAKKWSMAWETALLEACRQLEEASRSVSAALSHLTQKLGIPLPSDVNATQLNDLESLVRDLAQPDLPSEEIALHDQLSELHSGLEARHELLQQRDQAKQSLDAALVQFCESLGNSSDLVPDDMKRPLYLLANELVREKFPPADLVFHIEFEQLSTLLTERPGLQAARDEAIEALEARSFNRVLIDRLSVDDLESEWHRAANSFWPLSVWRTNATKKKLKACMKADGVAEPAVDLPLLCEYRDSRRRLVENLTAMGLRPPLQSAVEKDVTALDSRLQSATQLRSAITAAGFDPVKVGEASGRSLENLTSKARGLFPPGREYEALRNRLKENFAAIDLSPDLLAAIKNDANSLNEQIGTARRIQDSMASLGFSGNRLAGSLRSVLSVPASTRCETAGHLAREITAFQSVWVEYTQLANVSPADNASPALIAEAASAARQVLTHRTALKLWTGWLSVQERAEALGLQSFVKAIQEGELSPSDTTDHFKLAYARWWLPNAVDRSEALRTFQRFLHEDAIQDFCRLDDLARDAAVPRARQAVLHNLPPSDQVSRKSELGLLRHQMGLKRPSKSIREVIAGMPEAFGKLAPCLMMSPLSIAQYLPADQALFDVVVFDEASQIATWDAIGSIARGKQTIIVGDPKQLPPTNFFGKTESDEDNAELEDYEKDLESILDEAQASGLPTLQLNWHYRSRHESLIAFSNWNYYENRLVTFPAAESAGRGVSLRHIADGLYDRGKSRTNRREAEAIVADAVERMRRCLKKAEDKRLTYGVVTFNGQQQELIQDLFDEALRQQPELEWFFSDDRIEPTVVKNLENVQGDERDVMMFSITFGFDAAGKFPVDFGAINREGGERRLNVAVTRARQELEVFASFLPEQLRAERSAARGVQDLKAFLEYADKGPEAIIRRDSGSVGDHESPLEITIATALQDRGWRVDSQVGVSGFRIDLGIVHPDKPGAYLAGVECDGATYHRSAVARDRDKTRQQVLENLGWKIFRVWSTDWWYDPPTAFEKLDESLKQHLERDREDARNEQEEQAVADSRNETKGGPDPSIAPNTFQFIDPTGNEPELGSESIRECAEAAASPQLIAKNASVDARRVYSSIDLGDSTQDQDRFYDADYSDALRRMALSILNSHGPIRDDVLAREIARAHGFGRTGNRIKERVLALLPNVTTTEESVGTFLWAGDSPQESVPFRYATRNGERRSLDEIAMPELIGLVREHPKLAASDDPALALAREIGLARLSRSARDRLEAALERYGENS